MNQQYLEAIEYSLLEGRLGFLRDKGVNSDTRHLNDAFLNLMEDPRTSALRWLTIHSVSEMKDPQREAAADEALNGEENMMEIMFSDDDLFEETE